METNNTFTLGQRVRNFGIEATVWNYHQTSDGKRTGDLILRDDDGLKWVADPAKCEPCYTATAHADGLVIFA